MDDEPERKFDQSEEMGDEPERKLGGQEKGNGRHEGPRCENARKTVSRRLATGRRCHRTAVSHDGGARKDGGAMKLVRTVHPVSW